MVGHIVNLKKTKRNSKKKIVLKQYTDFERELIKMNRIANMYRDVIDMLDKVEIKKNNYKGIIK